MAAPYDKVRKSALPKTEAQVQSLVAQRNAELAATIDRAPAGVPSTEAEYCRLADAKAATTEMFRHAIHPITANKFRIGFTRR